MAHRLLFWTLFCIALAVGVADAPAMTIDVLVSLTTGEVLLRNPNPVTFGITGYSIETDPGNLNSAFWTSITDNYDDSGDGSVDPNDDWFVLSSPGSTSNLSEVEFLGDGGSLTAHEIVSLGTVWSLAVAPDAGINVDVSQPLGMATVDVYYLHDSDYNEDLIVDDADLDLWELYRGSGTMPSEGDGDRDGDVDGDDLLLWQVEAALTGLSVLNAGAGAGAGSGLLSVATVPEPTTGYLLIVGGTSWLLAAWTRRSLMPRR